MQANYFVTFGSWQQKEHLRRSHWSINPNRFRTFFLIEAARNEEKRSRPQNSQRQMATRLAVNKTSATSQRAPPPDQTILIVFRPTSSLLLTLVLKETLLWIEVLRYVFVSIIFHDLSEVNWIKSSWRPSYHKWIIDIER